MTLDLLSDGDASAAVEKRIYASHSTPDPGCGYCQAIRELAAGEVEAA